MGSLASRLCRTLSSLQLPPSTGSNSNFPGISQGEVSNPNGDGGHLHYKLQFQICVPSEEPWWDAALPSSLCTKGRNKNVLTLYLLFKVATYYALFQKCKPGPSY